MKHIKRKFLRADKISDEVKQVFETVEPEGNAKEYIEAEGIDNFTAWIQTSDNFLIQCFTYQGEKAGYAIPEPHPVVLYFNAAQTYMKHVQESREKLFSELNTPTLASKQLDAFYTYFSLITLYTTFLYNALEAFMNSAIPDEYEHRRDNNRQTELLNKEQIQRFSNFDEKIKIIIPKATGKKFLADYPSQYDTLLKLKICRDEIIHTKMYASPSQNPYKKLFTIALDFDYESAIFAVRNYINYYEPNLIEDCNCGREH